jgi:hypothetical protein
MPIRRFATLICDPASMTCAAKCKDVLNHARHDALGSDKRLNREFVMSDNEKDSKSDRRTVEDRRVGGDRRAGSRGTDRRQENRRTGERPSETNEK